MLKVKVYGLMICKVLWFLLRIVWCRGVLILILVVFS